MIEKNLQKNVRLQKITTLSSFFNQKKFENYKKKKQWN